MKKQKILALLLTSIVCLSSSSVFASSRQGVWTNVGGGTYIADANYSTNSISSSATWYVSSGTTSIEYQTYVYLGAVEGVQPAASDKVSSNTTACNVSYNNSGMYAIHEVEFTYSANSNEIGSIKLP